MRNDLIKLVLQLDRKWSWAFFLNGSDDTGGWCDDDWIPRCDAVVEQIRHVEKELEKERGVEVTAEYRATLLQSNGTASKRAHLATQLPEEWVPAKTKDVRTSVTSADPLKVLQAEKGETQQAMERRGACGEVGMVSTFWWTRGAAEN